MKSVLLLLDEVPPDPQAGPASEWFVRLEDSLSGDPQDWLSAVARIGQVSDGHAWPPGSMSMTWSAGSKATTANVECSR